MEENRKNRGFCILLGFVVGIVIGVASFMIYDKLISNNETSKTGVENKEIVTDLPLDSTIVRRLSDIFYHNAYALLGDYGGYFYQSDKTVIRDIPNSVKVYMVLDMLGRPGIIEEERLKEEYQSMFGSNSTYTLEDIPHENACDMSYQYHKELDYYSKNIGKGCGDLVGNMPLTKLAYAKQITSSKEDRIEIYEYFCYKMLEGNISYYSDYNRTDLILKTDDVTLDNTIFTEYKDQLGMYKYTFVNDGNGRYLFTSVEKVK